MTTHTDADKEADTTQEQKSSISRNEEEILAFWNQNHIFEKTLHKPDATGEFVFYDGPPFATGLPHYGHILAGTIKDAFPRFQTMMGKHVRRQWGWDCHGLPIENLIEAELGLKTKKDIEDLGVAQFNAKAQESVLRYELDWSRIVPRSGRWIDMEHKYQTMDPEYTESIWWAFKTMYEKELVYKGYKSMHLCPRCETTLSNFEVNQGYKDVTDLSVTAKFELVDEPGTFVLAWTTTPWTLPGNVALAVNPEIDYVTLEKKDAETSENTRFIVAKERIEHVFGKDEYITVNTYKGAELVGKRYKPLFPYYVDADIEGDKDAMYKVYRADFVTTEDGTGIVHIAPAFGDDDMKLAQEYNIPFIQHVGMDGEFKPEVKDFKGKVKPKSDNDSERFSADIAVIKYLQEHNTFFSKEKIKHSYPHCWRCDTPLLNYATSSWFIAVPKIKEQLISENKKVSWVPSEIGQKRFGEWLAGARDWAVSRTRYWGAPLPVWECSECTEKKVFGSMDELKQAGTARNKYIVMRHGQSDSNVNQYISSEIDNADGLTPEGKAQVLNSAKELKEKGIDMIIASPFVRTKETAEIVATELGLPLDSIVYDKRLGEIDTQMNKKSWLEYEALFANDTERFTKKLDSGESYLDVTKRAGDFLFDIDTTYTGKTIAIVSHGGPLVSMHCITGMHTLAQTIDRYGSGDYMHKNAEWRELLFVQFSHNEKYEIDFHKPYIDEITLTCTCGGSMSRVPDVFDCWFESGSMPFAQHHYPFENTDIFNPEKHIGFPADFIAEGLDQTRGWFYTLLVISVALFGESPYKNVIVNGLVLAEDGKKMSKRLKNYPEVDHILDTYGADAMRYYMMSSQIVHGEDLRFSEKGVDEVVKKINMRLSNVHSFYDMYKQDIEHIPNADSDTILDTWILARLYTLGNEVTVRMNSYELDKATRPFMDFIDDLSTWYLRRSRDRFKGADEADKKKALSTTAFVLRHTAILLAPFMPFLAETIYQKIKNTTDAESVHLCAWPEMAPVDTDVIAVMQSTRDVVSKLLELRASSGIKVRQPLAAAYVPEALNTPHLYTDIIADEVNVKKVEITQDAEMSLDTVLTEDLKNEGLLRDMIRSIQEARKNKGLQPQDVVTMHIAVNAKGGSLVGIYTEEIRSVCGIDTIETEMIDGDDIYGTIELSLL